MRVLQPQRELYVTRRTQVECRLTQKKITWRYIVYHDLGFITSISNCNVMVYAERNLCWWRDLDFFYTQASYLTSTIVVLMYENIFSERIIRVWNSLLPSIVSFESLLSFNNSLGNVNLGVHTKYWSLFSFSFLLSLYLVFKLRLILCVLLLYACLCWLCGM